MVLERTQPIHVNRLRPFTPLMDGTPSVGNAAPEVRIPFEPTAWPKVGELVITLCDPEKDWQGKPFVVGRVLALQIIPFAIARYNGTAMRVGLLGVHIGRALLITKTENWCTLLEARHREPGTVRGQVP